MKSLTDMKKGPGSSIFLFEGRQTVNAGDSGFASPYVGSKRVFRYLHCGDFRACVYSFFIFTNWQYLTWFLVLETPRWFYILQ